MIKLLYDPRLNHAVTLKPSGASTALMMDGTDIAVISVVQGQHRIRYTTVRNCDIYGANGILLQGVGAWHVIPSGWGIRVSKSNILSDTRPDVRLEPE